MSGIQEITETQPFLNERYKSHYRDCFPVIQVALWIIVALGITAALLSQFGYLDHTFLYPGIGVASVSFLVATGIVFTKKNYLSMALNDVQTVGGLQEIVNSIQASNSNCSLIGCMTGYGNCVGANLDFVVTSTKLKGTVSNSELQNAIERLLDQSTSNCTLRLSDSDKLVFEQLCNSANQKCEAYTAYDNFEIPEKYLA